MVVKIKSTKITINEDKLYTALGWCGCADSEVTEVFENIINHLKTEDDCYYTDIAEKLNLSPLLVQIVLLELDRLKITEHGTAVRGSWLNGKKYKILTGATEESDYEA